jgi:hypothetical protein
MPNPRGTVLARTVFVDVEVLKGLHVPDAEGVACKAILTASLNPDTFEAVLNTLTPEGVDKLIRGVPKTWSAGHDALIANIGLAVNRCPDTIAHIPARARSHAINTYANNVSKTPLAYNLSPRHSVSMCNNTLFGFVNSNEAARFGRHVQDTMAGANDGAIDALVQMKTDKRDAVVDMRGLSEFADRVINLPGGESGLGVFLMSVLSQVSLTKATFSNVVRLCPHLDGKFAKSHRGLNTMVAKVCASADRPLRDPSGADDDPYRNIGAFPLANRKRVLVALLADVAIDWVATWGFMRTGGAVSFGNYTVDAQLTRNQSTIHSPDLFEVRITYSAMAAGARHQNIDVKHVMHATFQNDIFRALTSPAIWRNLKAASDINCAAAPQARHIARARARGVPEPRLPEPRLPEPRLPGARQAEPAADGAFRDGWRHGRQTAAKAPTKYTDTAAPAAAAIDDAAISRIVSVVVAEPDAAEQPLVIKYADAVRALAIGAIAIGASNATGAGARECLICMSSDFSTSIQFDCPERHELCCDCVGLSITSQLFPGSGSFAEDEWASTGGRLRCCPAARAVADDTSVMTVAPSAAGAYVASLAEYRARLDAARNEASVTEIRSKTARDTLIALREETAPSEEGSAARAIRTHIVERIMTSRCPHCKAPYDGYTGCSAVKCKCKKYHCGLCLAPSDDGQLTHAHVVTCKYNPESGKSYAFSGTEIDAVLRQAMADRVLAYLSENPIAKALAAHMRAGVIFDLAKNFTVAGFTTYELDKLVNAIYDL